MLPSRGRSARGIGDGRSRASTGLAFRTSSVRAGNGLTTLRAEPRLTADGWQGLAEKVGLGHVTEAIEGAGNPGGQARVHGPRTGAAFHQMANPEGKLGVERVQRLSFQILS
jgi:hypothetical protein